MKTSKTILVTAMVALGILASSPAAAHGHGGGVRFGIGIGIGYPGYWPGYYRDPYYAYPYYPYYPAYPVYPAYPAVVTVPAAPTTYVEQAPAQPIADSAPPSYWYYCADSKTYYPYVKECKSQWQLVTPQPPPQPQ
jgi:hypothetical protein